MLTCFDTLLGLLGRLEPVSYLLRAWLWFYIYLSVQEVLLAERGGSFIMRMICAIH